MNIYDPLFRYLEAAIAYNEFALDDTWVWIQWDEPRRDGTWTTFTQCGPLSRAIPYIREVIDQWNDVLISMRILQITRIVDASTSQFPGW